MLNKIKTSLRISHVLLDEDIQSDIDACLKDLEVCGVAANKEDPLILSAVKLWCKAAYTDDPVKAAAYQERYNAQKACLMMASGYRAEVSADE